MKPPLEIELRGVGVQELDHNRNEPGSWLVVVVPLRHLTQATTLTTCGNDHQRHAERSMINDGFSPDSPTVSI